MISFDNTKIAFQGKSDADLKRAYYLFRMLGNNSLVKVGKVLSVWAIKLHLPVKGIIKATVFKQFCGGENIVECRKTVAELHRFGIGTILDYSVEGKEAQEDFEHTTKEIIDTIEEAKENPAIPFSVFKTTGLTQNSLLQKISSKKDLTDSDRKNFMALHDRVDRICKKAFESGTPVFIDAEESWIQEAIDGLAIKMMTRYNREKTIVYNTWQFYRHDRLEHLKSIHEEALRNGYKIGVKLVRGAYMEKERERAKENNYPSPIQPDKEATDRDYDLALEYCMENLDTISICSGSHNENSNAFLAELMKQKNISPDDKRIYFAQLLGMSDHISNNLAHAGYNVVKYVPYGPVKEVLPYLIRRAEENTSVAGQTGRELSLITREIQRRKTEAN